MVWIAVVLLAVWNTYLWIQVRDINQHLEDEMVKKFQTMPL